MANIINGLRDLGFEGKAVYSEKATVDSLATATGRGEKAIVSVWQGGENSHAIVVDKVANGRAYIRDPAPEGIGSSYSIPLESLESSMTGRAVFLGN